MDVTIDGSFLIMHHEGRIKLCNTMVWFSNEDKLLNCLLLKKKKQKKQQPHCDQEERVSNTNSKYSNPEGKNMIQDKHWPLKYKVFKTDV